MHFLTGRRGRCDHSGRRRRLHCWTQQLWPLPHYCWGLRWPEYVCRWLCDSSKDRFSLFNPFRLLFPHIQLPTPATTPWPWWRRGLSLGSESLEERNPATLVWGNLQAGTFPLGDWCPWVLFSGLALKTNQWRRVGFVLDHLFFSVGKW